MSDTSDTPAPGGPADAAAEPAPTDTEAPAPAETGAADTAAADAEAKKPNREERRYTILSAQLRNAEQERGRMAEELAALRRQVSPPPDEPQLTPQQQAFVDARVQQAVSEQREQERVQGFHAAGSAAYPDWKERCASLMSMGADAGLAALLVETPDGANVAAALADEPEALERIAGLKSERARAIALGKFAASVADKPAPASRTISRAPPPIKPIGGGSAKPAVDEYALTSAQLVELYSKQAMDARRNR